MIPCDERHTGYNVSRVTAQIGSAGPSFELLRGKSGKWKMGLENRNGQRSGFGWYAASMY